MDTQLRVVLYGQSLVLGALAASLRLRQQLEVICVAPCLENSAAQELAALMPDVILFDAGAGFPEAAFSLLQTCPALRVVGIDPSENQAMLWAGQSLNELSVNDLVHTLLAH